MGTEDIIPSELGNKVPLAQDQTLIRGNRFSANDEDDLGNEFVQGILVG